MAANPPSIIEVVNEFLKTAETDVRNFVNKHMGELVSSLSRDADFEDTRKALNSIYHLRNSITKKPILFDIITSYIEELILAEEEKLLKKEKQYADTPKEEKKAEGKEEKKEEPKQQPTQNKENKEEKPFELEINATATISLFFDPKKSADAKDTKEGQAEKATLTEKSTEDQVRESADLATGFFEGFATRAGEKIAQTVHDKLYDIGSGIMEGLVLPETLSEETYSHLGETFINFVMSTGVTALSIGTRSALRGEVPDAKQASFSILTGGIVGTIVGEIEMAFGEQVAEEATEIVGDISQNVSTIDAASILGMGDYDNADSSDTAEASTIDDVAFSSMMDSGSEDSGYGSSSSDTSDDDTFDE